MKKFFENKKILVAGGSGFLGKNFILNLLKFNCKIISTVHINKSVIKSKKIKYFKCDLTSLNDCKKVIKFLFSTKNGEYLYQNWKYGSLIIDYRNTDIDDSKLLELLGVDMLGIDIEGLIELYFEE